MNRRHILMAFALFSAVVLSSCDYFKPSRDVNGSVFIVTSGAGAYKLALVKVYFCDADDFKAKIQPVVATFADEDSEHLKDALEAEKAFVNVLNKGADNCSKQKQVFSDMQSEVATFGPISDTLDKCAHQLEQDEKDGGRPYAMLYNPSRVLKDKFDRINDYFSAHIPTTSEQGILVSMNKVKSDLGASLGKTQADLEKVLQDGQTVKDEMGGVEDKFKSAKATLASFPDSVADLCAQKTDAAIVTAETDADGKFQVQIPKNRSLVVVAKAERTVGLGKESYWWFVALPKGSDPVNLSLTNENILSTPQGSSIVDIHSKGADEQWKASQDAEAHFKQAMADSDEPQTKMQAALSAAR